MAWSPSANATAAAALFRAHLADQGITASDELPPKALFDAFDSYISGGGGGPSAPALTVAAKSAAFSAAAGYHYRCTGGTYAATLPAGTGVAGQLLSVKNVSATTVTVTCAGGDLIDGAASALALVAGEAALLVAHSSGWDLI